MEEMLAPFSTFDVRSFGAKRECNLRVGPGALLVRRTPPLPVAAAVARACTVHTMMDRNDSNGVSDVQRTSPDGATGKGGPDEYRQTSQFRAVRSRPLCSPSTSAVRSAAFMDRP